MEREYVGIDFHRRRSVVVRIERRVVSGCRWCGSTTVRRRWPTAVTAAGDHPEVVIGGDLRLVLGGGRVAGVGCDGASGQPERVELG